MTNSLKTVKLLGLGLLVLAALSAGWYFLVALGVLTAPPALQNLPGMSPASGGEKTPGKGSPAELVQLEQNLAEQQAEINGLQASLSAAETALMQSQDSEARLKEEVARLNQEVLNLKSGAAAKTAAYKDMAPYFANMKAKDAADILSRLKDDDIIGILSAMEKETAAEILPFMNRDRAAAVASKMLVTEP